MERFIKNVSKFAVCSKIGEICSSVSAIASEFGYCRTRTNDAKKTNTKTSAIRC